MSNAAQYVPAVVWIVLLSYVLHRHRRVYRLYAKQLAVVAAIESHGGIETGSTLVAANQLFRYKIRIILASFGIAIGLGGTYGVYNPEFGRSAGFGVAVLSYFYLSEGATGYLTARDERVIQHLLLVDSERAEDDAQGNDVQESEA